MLLVLCFQLTILCSPLLVVSHDSALRNRQGTYVVLNTLQKSYQLKYTQSFADVPINADGVDTATFLEASDGLVQMFGEISTTDFDL